MEKEVRGTQRTSSNNGGSTSTSTKDDVLNGLVVLSSEDASVELGPEGLDVDAGSGQDVLETIGLRFGKEGERKRGEGGRQDMRTAFSFFFFFFWCVGGGKGDGQRWRSSHRGG